MPKVKFSAMKALPEAIHYVFFEFVFFYDLFIAVAFAACFDLMLATHRGVFIFGRHYIMRGAVTVKAERTVCLILLGDVFTMHTSQYHFVSLFMAGDTGSPGNRIDLEFR